MIKLNYKPNTSLDQSLEFKIQHVRMVGDLGYAGVSKYDICLLYTSPSPRDATLSRMPYSD